MRDGSSEQEAGSATYSCRSVTHSMFNYSLSVCHRHSCSRRTRSRSQCRRRVVAAVAAIRVKTADGTPLIVARAFLRNEKAAAIPAAAAVITLLVFLGIGVIVFAQVMGQAKNVATNLNDSQALAFITSATDMGYTALNLLMIAAFVMAAIVILAIVMRLGGGGGQ
jgi:hypothetical protein